jgi:hypothetical protein
MQGEEYWKPLAIKRRYENKAMKGRMRELSESRDIWKEKAMTFKQENARLVKQIETIKKKLIGLSVE